MWKSLWRNFENLKVTCIWTIESYDKELQGRGITGTAMKSTGVRDRLWLTLNSENSQKVNGGQCY